MKNRKSMIKISLSIIVAMALFTTYTFAASYPGPTKTWSYSNYNHGSYVPKTGSMKSTFYDDSSGTRFTTVVNCTLDSTNVSNILDYNNGGDNPGTVADNKKCYLTLDISSISDSTDDKVEATSMASALPDPKYDLEDDNFDGDNEESEVVALGTVKAQSYNTTTYWNDFRTGYSGDSGTINAQFAMSAKGVSDYNTVVQSDVVQASFAFGDNPGRP